MPGAVPLDTSVLQGQQYLPWLMGHAHSQELRLVRFFGASDIDGGLQGSPLQTAPGTLTMLQLAIAIGASASTLMISWLAWSSYLGLDVRLHIH